MKLTLCDRNPAMVTAWRASFWGHFPEVDIVQDDLQNIDLAGTCVVSPSNSFGLFTGGVDYYIAKMAFPDDHHALTRITQKEIVANFGGQVPVGSCFIMPVNERLPFLGICPTMRTPATRLPMDSTIPYDCAFSAIAAAERYNAEHCGAIENLLMFGFGTGVGGLSEAHCARMMSLATKHCDLLRSLPTEAWNSRGFTITHNTVSKIGREIDRNALGRS